MNGCTAMARCTSAVSDAPLLDVNGIEVIYNHVMLVLKGVSLQVREGSIVAVLGGNGAGKTTTLRVVSNLLAGERDAVTKGSIALRGEQNTHMALQYADHGYILESGRIVMDGAAAALRENEDVREFYLGSGAASGERKSYRDVKSYKRRKRWLS